MRWLFSASLLLVPFCVQAAEPVKQCRMLMGAAALQAPLLWQDAAKPKRLHGLVREVRDALKSDLQVDIKLHTDTAESVAMVEAATGRSDLLFGVRRDREQLGQFDIIEPELLRLSYRIWMLPQQVLVEPELPPEVADDIHVAQDEPTAPAQVADAQSAEPAVEEQQVAEAAAEAVNAEPVYKQVKPKIKDWRDLRDLKGVIPKGSTVGDEFDRFAKSKLTLKEVDSTLHALKLLDAGEADYAVLEYNSVLLADSQFAAAQAKPLPVGPVIHREGLYLGVSHNSACNSSDLRAALAQKLYDWQQNGTLQGLRKDARALWQLQFGLAEPAPVNPAPSSAPKTAVVPAAVVAEPVDAKPLSPVAGELIED